mgnify:CR=1 FL=1
MNFETLTGFALNIELNSADSTQLYTSTRRDAAINEAYEEFCALTKCLKRDSTVTCSCLTVEYNILSTGVLQNSSDDYLELAPQGVEYRLASSGGSSIVSTRIAAGDDFPQLPIQHRNRYDVGWRVSTVAVDLPKGYYVRSDGPNLFVGLAEPPSIGSSEVGRLIIPYILRGKPMTSSGAEPFTVNSTVRTDLLVYHKALPHYAAYKLLPLIGDGDGANAQLQKFLGYVARFTQSQRPKGGQHVTMARNYLGEQRGAYGWRTTQSSVTNFTWVRGG